MRAPFFAAILLVAACRGATPDGAYRAFAKAASERDGDVAWGLLSAKAKEVLKERAKAAAARAPGVVTDDPKLLLLGPTAAAVKPLRSVLVVKESGDAAVLKV